MRFREGTMSTLRTGRSLIVSVTPFHAIISGDTGDLLSYRSRIDPEGSGGSQACSPRARRARPESFGRSKAREIGVKA